MARRVVEGVRVALGPVPIDEGDPRVIDVQLEDDDGVPDVPFEALVPPGATPPTIDGTSAGPVPED